MPLTCAMATWAARRKTFCKDERAVASTLSLPEVAEAFAAIADAAKPARKQQITLDLLKRATPLEAKYLIKIILGDMRTGIQVSLVEEAIAAAYSAPIGDVRRARMLNGNLPEVLELAATRPAGRGADEALSSPRLHAGQPGRDGRGGLAALHHRGGRGSQVCLSEVHPDGPVIKEAQLEDKYDGVRAQIHCGSPEHPGRVALYSRSREDMTASFPEIVEAFAGFEEPLVLDGEILAWSRRPCAAILLLCRHGWGASGSRRRCARPLRWCLWLLICFTPTANHGWTSPCTNAGVRWKSWWSESSPNQGEQPPGRRGQQTELLFEPAAPEDSFARLVLAPAVQLESVEQLEQAYVDARARGNEGVMLKARHSTYQPGRRGLAWLKLKRELATLDVVVTAAEYGHGKRAGWLSDYTFAVRDGEVLRNVGKAYSGVTDAEIARLTQFFLEHTLEDFGSIRAVEPLVVLEVAFNNVMRSDRHDSGFALRFPRILRIRDDKPVSEIDTLERVAEIYQSQPDKPVQNIEDSGA